jgi:plasmid stabilization system protein ParE
VKPRFTEAASADVREARAFYGKRGRLARIGLNRELRRVLTLLREHPEAGKSAGKTAREFVMDIYPYSVIYYLDKDEVVIAALYHHSRDPEFWHNRFRTER